MGIDLTALSLAKQYTDKKIGQAELGETSLDTTLTKSGFAADAKAVGDAINNINISENNFYIPVNYDSVNKTYSLNEAINIDDIKKALTDNKHLIVKIMQNNSPIYYMPMIANSTDSEGTSLSFSNGSSQNPSGKNGVLLIMIYGTSAFVSFNSINDINANAVACDIIINGKQKTNVTDALNALNEIIGTLGIAEEVAY